MATFNGVYETSLYFVQHSADNSAINLTGWSYSGTSSDDQILGSDYTTRTRSDGTNVFTDTQTGTDTLNGNSGNDYIEGGTGNDSISGGDGADTITGSGDNDFVAGNAGADQAFGGSGADTVRGGQGDDVVAGEAGNDFVSGDAGNDVLSGGSGADTFNFATAFGSDVITDFNRSEGDSVRIESGSYSLSQSGSDTIVTMSDGATLTLQNVTYSTLDAGWIHS